MKQVRKRVLIDARAFGWSEHPALRIIRHRTCVVFPTLSLMVGLFKREQSN